MMIKKISLFTAFASLCLVFSGCAKDLPPGSYDASEVGKVKKVVPGVIISKRPINIFAKKAQTSDDPSVPAGDSVKRTHGYEFIVKLNDGDIVSVAQDEDLKLKVKQHVLVIYGGNTRIVADEGSDD